jgi:hypothetical protein
MPPDRRDYYREWYEKNREARNARRRARYADSEELREREKDRVRTYREEKRDPKEAGKVYRSINGKKHQVFRVGQVAAIVGTHPSVLRRYERHGILPETVFEGEHRFYTAQQVELVAELVRFKRNTRYSWRRPEKSPLEKRLILKVQKLWSEGL